MDLLRAFLIAMVGLAATLIGATPAFAQVTTGVPGSPDATTTIDGHYPDSIGRRNTASGCRE